MEVAMETGTLKELNVKPGDVVEWVSINEPDDFTKDHHGKLHTIKEDYRVMLGDGPVYWGYVRDNEDDTVVWRIISRASKPAQPAPDLTALTAPFGLLDEATQEALRAHGGPYETYGTGGWHPVSDPAFRSWTAYRVKPSPIIETEHMQIINADGMLLANATVTTRNGKPDWSTLQVQDD